MKITYEKLVDYNACAQGLNWFQDTFGEEADLEELINKVPKTNRFWLFWLVTDYPGVMAEWQKTITPPEGWFHVTEGLIQEGDRKYDLFDREFDMEYEPLTGDNIYGYFYIIRKVA